MEEKHNIVAPVFNFPGVDKQGKRSYLAKYNLILLSHILKKSNSNKNHLRKLIIFDKVTNCVIRELIRGVIF